MSQSDSGQRGPPDDVVQNLEAAKRQNDGTIAVSDDRLAELASQINWNNLSPFEEWVVGVLDEKGLLPE